MVICQGELDAVVPLEPASMPGRVVIQWDKDDCAEMGIVKVDLLGLGMMAALQDAIELVNTGIRDQGSGIKNSGTPNPRIPDPRSPIPLTVALRRFRFPVPARVRVDRGAPVRVISDRRGWSGGHVETYAGPWRSSGGWWVDTADVHRDKPRSHGGVSASPWPVEVKAWERDEWDVTLSDGATYRIFRERDTDAWFIEGVVD
jgi:hypothetical protein